MAVLDRPARKLALTLIRKFGQTVTLEYTTGGDYDPATRKVTGGTKATDTPKALIGEYKARFQGGQVMVSESSKDRLVTIAASALSNGTPEENTTRVKIGSAWHDVKRVNPVYSGDEVAIYEMQAVR